MDVSMEKVFEAIGDHVGRDCDCPACSGPKMSVDGMVANLMEDYESFVKGCAFAPGQLVTPKKMSGLKGDGEPHIVIEVFADPIRFTDCDPGAPRFGMLLDMRVACVSGSLVIRYSVESTLFEPWSQETHGVTDKEKH